jgi:deoxycytidine triphosphate deaminase
MILVDYQIKQCIDYGNLNITPYNEESVNPNSYDLHLSNQFKYYINNGQMIDPYDRNTIIYGHEVVEADTFTIQPGMFVLAVSQETISLPKNICAT